MYHTFGSHKEARSKVTHSFCIVFYNEVDTFAEKLTTVTHLGHPWRGNAVRCVKFETLISEGANVSHIGLPYWVRSRVTHSLCLVFYNEFDTFAKKLTTVRHFEHTAIKIIVFYNEFETLISECAKVSHIWLP